MTLTRRGRLVTLLVIIVILFGVPALGGYIYLRSIGFYGESDPRGRVAVVIPRGADAGRVGDILEEAGVVDSGFGFVLATRIDGGFEDIQAGRYELFRGLTARDALATLTKRRPLAENFVTVTFPEGSWLEDFAARLEEDTHLSKRRFLRLVTSGGVDSPLLPSDIETLEGLLFPSTYQIIKKDSEAEVARRLVDQMVEETDELDFEAKAEALGVTPYEAVIVASMIEAEAKAPGDRDKIARVIYNRLEEGMRLDIDATVLYALGEHKKVLTNTDLEVDSPYNTRMVAGLPPTPIGAPGAGSLEAAANPADGDWLYYVVSDCAGHHAFSESYDEFLQNKAKYQALEC
jgi:peptidoglycan lytic transglycosylase G